MHNRIYKALFILLLFSFLSEGVFAQNISWSPVHKLSKKTGAVEIIGKSNQGYLIHIFGSKEHFIALYDVNMKQEWIKPLILEGKSVRLEEIILPKDTMIMIYSTVGEDYIRSYYARKLSFDGRPSKPVKIGELDVDSRQVDPRMRVKLSKDRTKILCYLKRPNEKPENTRTLLCHVFTTNLQRIGEKEIRIPFKKSTWRIENFVLDNNGNSYFLIRYRNTKLKKSNPFRKQFFLYEYLIEQDITNNYDLNLGEKYVSSVKLNIDNLNKKVSVGGFYSDNSFYSITGTFNLCVDLETSKLLPLAYQKIDSAFLVKLVAERISAHNGEINDFTIKDMVLRDDGGIILIAESEYEINKPYNAPNVYNTYTTNTITYYHYNDILIFSINPDGSVHWNKVVKKRQVSRENDGYYTSYSLSIRRDRIFLIFNDDISRNNNVVQYSISNKGEINVRNLFKDIIATGLSMQLGEDEILIPSIYRSNLRLVKLQY
ncbi:MAG: hypothetical protein IIA45_01595 [Bacteroidetes bacterium]|nr:hypothetical protein [Bacteroidota bacterium]